MPKSGQGTAAYPERESGRSYRAERKLRQPSRSKILLMGRKAYLTSVIEASEGKSGST